MPAFAEVMSEFRAVQERYAHFGAADTEPRAVMSYLLGRLRDARSVEIPSSAAGWELFDDMDGVDVAAQALANAAGDVIAAGRQDLVAVAREVGY